jgi:hypothetical protein
MKLVFLIAQAVQNVSSSATNDSSWIWKWADNPYVIVPVLAAVVLLAAGGLSLTGRHDKTESYLRPRGGKNTSSDDSEKPNG